MADAGANRVAPSLEWSVDALLVGGAQVTIRPLRPGDRAAVREFFGGLSLETLRLRYLVQHQVRTQEMDQLTGSDGTNRVHLAAFRSDVIIGVADFRRTGALDAEVSFVVADEFQGRGLGSRFLQSLAAAARNAGICRFHADTFAENQRMLAVFRHSGLPVNVSAPQAGMVTVLIDLATGIDPRGSRIRCDPKAGGIR